MHSVIIDSNVVLNGFNCNRIAAQMMFDSNRKVLIYNGA